MEPHHVGQLLQKLRISGKLEGAAPLGLEVMSATGG